MAGPDGVRLYYQKLGSGPKVINLQRHFQYHFAGIQQMDVPRADVARVRVPVLTIHGTRDRNVPYTAGREWALTLSGRWPAGVERVTSLERAASR